MLILILVLKFIAAGIFVLAGLYLIWLGIAQFQVPSIFLGLYGVGLVFIGLVLLGAGVLTFLLWDHVWVRYLVAAIGALALFWLVQHQFAGNKIEQSAKAIVHDWCRSEELGSPEEFVFDNRYHATCGRYSFERGQMNRGNGLEETLIVTSSEEGGKKDIHKEFIHLPSTVNEARPILLKLKSGA